MNLWIGKGFKSRALNWRIRPNLCIRLIFGLWIPQIYHNREMKHFTIMLPGIAIAFDYWPAP